VQARSEAPAGRLPVVSLAGGRLPSVRDAALLAEKPCAISGIGEVGSAFCEQTGRRTTL